MLLHCHCPLPDYRNHLNVHRDRNGEAIGYLYLPPFSDKRLCPKRDFIDRTQNNFDKNEALVRLSKSENRNHKVT